MPSHQLRIEIERTQQRQRALHLLILSGVVRPSDVKLHYAISPLNSDDQSHAFLEKSVPAVQPLSLRQKFFELMSWPPRMRDHSDTIELRFLNRLSTSTRSSR